MKRRVSKCHKTRFRYYGEMKTTLDLPDDLMRAVKIRAVRKNLKLKDAIAELLKRGLAREPGAPAKVRNRVRLPLVRCAHEALGAEEMTPERLAEVPLEEEATPTSGGKTCAWCPSPSS